VPGGQHRQPLGRGKSGGDAGAGRVGDDALLQHPQDEDADSRRQVLQPWAIDARIGELRHHVAVVQDRPGDQVREEGDEQDVVQQAAVLRHILPAIDQEQDLREGEEADPERQPHAGDRLYHPVRRAAEAEQPGQILEPDQQAKVGGDRESQHPGLRARPRAQRQQQPPRGVIAGGRSRQQRHRRGVPPAIEDE